METYKLIFYAKRTLTTVWTTFVCASRDGKSSAVVGGAQLIQTPAGRFSWTSAGDQILTQQLRATDTVSSPEIPGRLLRVLESGIGRCTGREQAKSQRTISLHRAHSFWIYSSTTRRRLQALEGKGLINILPFSVRSISIPTALLARQKPLHDEQSEKDLTMQEDPFDTITDKIPEKPVSVAEGASYSVIILLGLGIAGAAAFAVFKELLFEPKEYKVYGKALDRVQHDSQVSGRLGAPITGYGQESRNRAARQRISNRTWTDELGIERIEVMFHIRGPAGAGKVYSEMFKDPEDKTWKYTYLIVDVTSPTPIRLMLESYVPNLVPLSPS